MLYPDLQAICASVAMAFPKGPDKGYRLVADLSPINSHCELVPGPMRNPKIEGDNGLATWFLYDGLPSRLLAVPAGRGGA